ncbi:MAG: hypothetical protein ACK5MP_09200 [Nostocoides sp.]
MSTSAAEFKAKVARSVIPGPSTPIVTAHRLRPGRLLARLAIVLGVTQMVFFGGLVLGQMVPDKPVIQRLAQAVDDGTYGPSSLPDRMGGISDSFTECVVVGTGLGAPPDQSALYRAAYMPRISNCASGGGQIKTLSWGGEVDPSPYFKYWAGYTVLVRPVLAIAGMEGVRLVIGALLAAGIAVGVGGFARRSTWPLAVMLFGPLLIASNVMSTPSTALSNALALAVMFAGLGISAWAAPRGMAAVALVSMMAGSLYCYVDLLTNPPLAWMLTMSVTAIIVARTVGARSAMASSLIAGLAWILGFGLTWVSRWLIAMAWVGPAQTLAVVKENVAFRTTGSNPVVQSGIGQGITANTQWWWTRVPSAAPLLWLLLAALVVAGTVWLIRSRHLPGWRAVAALLIPALVPVLWYVVMSNHSQIHAFFTYRAVPGAVGVIGAGLLAALFLPREDGRSMPLPATPESATREQLTPEQPAPETPAEPAAIDGVEPTVPVPPSDLEAGTLS